jgi:hypothetical protein
MVLLITSYSYNRTSLPPDKAILSNIFFVPYLSALLVVSCCWLVWADAMFWIFMLTSAFHFGQSQLHHIKFNERHWIKVLLYVNWGILLLSHLWITHWQSQVPVLGSVFNWDLQQFGLVHQIVWFSRLSTSILVPLLLVACLFQKQIAFTSMLQELGVIFLLLLTIQYCSLYTSFAFYSWSLACLQGHGHRILFPPKGSLCPTWVEAISCSIFTF